MAVHKKLAVPEEMFASWRFLFWLSGLLLAPLLFGANDLEGQAIVGLLSAVSLCLIAGRTGSVGSSVALLPGWYGCLAAILVVLPLVPLPITVLEVLSPARVRLQQLFPPDLDVLRKFEPLSLSQGRGFERLAEYLLVIMAFVLCRRATAHPRFSTLLIAGLAFTMVLLAASDLWLRLDPERRALGLRADPGGHAAGTFANRNHFANWIYVAVLFAMGALPWIRKACRASRFVSNQGGIVTSTGGAVALGLALVIGLIAALQTGSRGGLLAFLGGVLTWVVLLWKPSRRHRRIFPLAVGVLICLFVILVGTPTTERFATLPANATFKMAIWADALSLLQRFPFFGTGPGTFEVAFNHFKTFGGSSTFLHAENDWIQLLVEHGCLGAGLFLLGLAGLIGLIRRWVVSARLEQPELVFGAIAALVAFGVHALVEFVWQVPANALLAATLLGFLFGCRDRGRRPAVLPPPTARRILFNLSWAAAVLVVAGAQGMASFHAYQSHTGRSLAARTESLAHSLRFWPWSTSRQIGLARLELARAENTPAVAPEPRVRAQLTAAIRDNPFHWELRLERAWMDLADRGDAAAVEEAWRVVRLNPLQPRIPLEFAARFVSWNEEIAWAFLEAASIKTLRADELRQLLELAWKVRGDPGALWTLTPPTAEGLEVLAGFARQQKLAGLALEAERFKKD